MQYLRTISCSFGWVKDEDMSLAEIKTARDLNPAATWAMDYMCYEEHKSVQEGKDLRSGLMHICPDLKRQMPSSARALQSWAKLEGNPERKPLGDAGMAKIISQMALKDFWFGWSAWSQVKTRVGSRTSSIC